MAKRKENMLEAFKASTETVRNPEIPGGVDVPVAAAVTVPPAPVSAAREPAHDDRLVLPMGAIPFLALQAFLLVVVFLMGRFSVAEGVAAADGDGTGPTDPGGRIDLAATSGTGEGPRSGVEPAGSADGRTAADRAFHAPENKFSILVITYDDSPENQEMALATYEYLRDSGYPVVTPRSRQGNLLVFVGAAGAYQDLEALEKEIKRLTGPGGRGNPFRTAYRVNIEDYM